MANLEQLLTRIKALRTSKAQADATEKLMLAQLKEYGITSVEQAMERSSVLDKEIEEANSKRAAAILTLTDSVEKYEKAVRNFENATR